MTGGLSKEGRHSLTNSGIMSNMRVPFLIQPLFQFFNTISITDSLRKLLQWSKCEKNKLHSDYLSWVLIKLTSPCYHFQNNFYWAVSQKRFFDQIWLKRAVTGLSWQVVSQKRGIFIKKTLVHRKTFSHNRWSPNRVVSQKRLYCMFVPLCCWAHD